MRLMNFGNQVAAESSPIPRRSVPVTSLRPGNLIAQLSLESEHLLGPCKKQFSRHL